MQTKLVILASIFGVISALCFSTNQNILLSLSSGLFASALFLAAYFSKDKKDRQIEEIHTITTNNNKTEQVSSSDYNISDDFLARSHALIFSRFNEDAKLLSRKLRFQGRFNSTYGMSQFAEHIASYVNEFLTQIKEHSAKIHGDNALLNQQVEKQLDRYLESDLNFVKQKLALVFRDRAGSTFMSNVIRENEVVIRRMYAEFVLKMIRHE